MHLSPNLRAVVFDFDGTLADSYAAITASVNHVRAVHHLPPLPEAAVRGFVGRGLAYLLEQLVPGVEPERAVACYRGHHGSVMRDGTRLLPGVASTLASLHAAGLKLGVCSNKLSTFTRALLDYLDLAPLVDVVIGPDNAPRPKPAPDMLEAVLAQLGVAATEALYVGDMRVDIETARGAGVTVWVVATGSDSVADLAAARPDRLLADFTELVELVRS